MDGARGNGQETRSNGSAYMSEQRMDLEGVWHCGLKDNVKQCYDYDMGKFVQSQLDAHKAASEGKIHVPGGAYPPAKSNTNNSTTARR